MESLEQRGVKVLSMREGIDYSTPVGKMVVQILASVAEMERNLISSRTKAGVAAAKAKGKTLGRPSIIPESKQKAAISLVVEDGLSIRKAAKKVGISAWYLSDLIRKRQS